MNPVVFLVIFVFIIILCFLLIGGRKDRNEPSKKRAENCIPEEKFDLNFNLDLFPGEKDEAGEEGDGGTQLEFILQCPRCGKNMVLDQFAEDGFSQNPDGGWWVCPEGCSSEE